MESCVCIWAQSSEIGVESVAAKGRFWDFNFAGGCRDWRRLSSWDQRFRAADSAARTVTRWSVFSAVNGSDKELVAMRAFWRRIRVLMRASKADCCCLMAFPLARSAFVAAEMVAMTDFCDSAIICRRAARSLGTEGEESLGTLLELMLALLLAPEMISSSSISELSSSLSDMLSV